MIGLEVKRSRARFREGKVSAKAGRRRGSDEKVDSASGAALQHESVSAAIIEIYETRRRTF